MRRRSIASAALALACALVTSSVAMAAEPGEQTASWRLEQPSLPPPPPGESGPPAPVPLGTVGDIEFWEPPGSPPQANRGLLITHGNGDAVPAGVWAYDGRGWHEIAKVCGATNGRIAWGGPADFWTVSDGRPGQAPVNGQLPPLEDNSLCHFSDGSIVASYAHLAFEADSYERMSGAACLPPQPPEASSTDCWFGGEKLSEPQIGAFQLHWNGSTLEEQPYMNQGDPIRDMRQLENAIFESVAYSVHNPHNEERTSGRPPVLHFAEAETGMQPLEEELPLYGVTGEPTEELQYLRLGSTEGVLWAATGKQLGISGLTREEEGQVTVLRRLDGVWTQVIGPGGEGQPGHPLPDLFASEQEEAELLGGPARNAEVRAIAPEPGSEDAWLALAPLSSEREAAGVAVLVHISAQGEVLGVQTLPDSAERALPSDAAGAAERLVCPALEDCWMANVNGWLYHLAREGERTLAQSELPGFPEGKIISERPHDEGVPQEVLDAPPPDTSGLQEEPPGYGGKVEQKTETKPENKVTLPLLSHVGTRLIKGTMLQLSFHLAVKARVRLIAKRKSRVVAETGNEVLKAGNRKLTLSLNPKNWPTKLALQTHALAPLPVVSSVSGEGANVTTESTGLLAVPFHELLGEAGRLP